MDRVLAGLKPEKYFYYFEEISRIPRSSGEEKAVSDYVVNFAQERGLKVYQDEAWNVYISKPATPGYENRKGIMLQGHLDMVCVKDDGVEHDFSKDPIELVIDGDWVKANGTTLGADNGTAVAMMLMILDSDDVEHPALQCIFTTEEEVGLIGASRLHPEKFEGDYLINLDGGSFDNLLLASAGNSNHLFDVPVTETAVTEPETKKGMHVAVKLMAGGHSGGLAHNCQGNAIKVLADLLCDLYEEVPFELVGITGGDKINAIAVSASADIVYPAAQEETVKKLLAEYAHEAKREYASTDPDMTVEMTEIDVPACVYDKTSGETALTFLEMLFDGTYRYMDNKKKDMAKTSCNIGILRRNGDYLHADCLMRSNSDYVHRQLMRKMEKLGKLLNIKHVVSVYSGAWEYDPESSLVTKLNQLYQQEFNYTPEVVMTHGGMEPGTIIGLGKSIGKKIEAMNMGVKSSGAHTTAEKMCISAVQKTYDWLKIVMRSLD